jgi:hypothetical protein
MFAHTLLQRFTHHTLGLSFHQSSSHFNNGVGSGKQRLKLVLPRLGRKWEGKSGQEGSKEGLFLSWLNYHVCVGRSQYWRLRTATAPQSRELKLRRQRR